MCVRYDRAVKQNRNALIGMLVALVLVVGGLAVGFGVQAEANGINCGTAFSDHDVATRLDDEATKAAQNAALENGDVEKFMNFRSGTYGVACGKAQRNLLLVTLAIFFLAFVALVAGVLATRTSDSRTR